MITPVDTLYSRNHLPIPDVDPSAWRLRVDDLVDTPLLGAPVRVVPGYIGACSVTRVAAITATSLPADNYFQSTSYRLLPPTPPDANRSGCRLPPRSHRAQRRHPLSRARGLRPRRQHDGARLRVCR